jgi:hypothetical protein
VSVKVKIAKLRAGSYSPRFLESRRTAEKALAAGIQEAFYEQLPICKAIQRQLFQVWLVLSIRPVSGHVALASMGSANPHRFISARSNAYDGSESLSKTMKGTRKPADPI